MDSYLSLKRRQTLKQSLWSKTSDIAKKSTTDAIKTALKSAIQKTDKATDDFTGNKIADKITSVSKKPAMELYSKELPITIIKQMRK